MATTNTPINVDQLLAYGEKQIGKPYVFGQAGPNSFDCSGLISYMYKQFGVDLPHHAASQAKLGSPVAESAIQKGDLVFSDWGDGPNSHVGIATDPTHILVAPHTGTDVQVESLGSDYRKHITSVRRVGNLTGGTDSAASVPTTGTGTPATTGGSASQSNALTSFWTGLFSVIPGGAGVANTFSGPYREIAKPLQDVGSAAVEMAAIGDRVMSLFLPSNFTRVVAGGAGLLLLFIGLFFIARELRG